MATVSRPFTLTSDQVVFNCPGCREELFCPHAEAGTKQACPYCSAAIVVPGADELRKLAQREEAFARIERENADRQRAFEAQRTVNERRRQEENEKRVSRYGLILTAVGPVAAFGKICILLGIFVAGAGLVIGFLLMSQGLARDGLLVIAAGALSGFGYACAGYAVQLFAGIGRVLVQIAEKLDQPAR